MVALSLALIPQPGIEENGWRVSFSDCEKVTILDKYYNKSKNDFFIVIFLLSEVNDEERKVVGDKLEKMEISSQNDDFNINYLIYSFSLQCNVNVIDFFVDILLNDTLNNGKPFKIIGIIAGLSSNELAQLSNIVSPYSIPVISVTPEYKSMQKIWLGRKYYENIMFPWIDFKDLKSQVVFKAIEKLNMKFVSILHDNNDKVNFEELKSIANHQKRNSICVHLYSVKDYIFQIPSIFEMLMKEEPAVFLVEFCEVNLFLKLVYLFKEMEKSRLIYIIVINTNDKYGRPLFQKLLQSIYKENSSNVVILEVGEHYMGSLHDFFKNAIHSVIEIARSYKNTLVENALLQQLTRTFNTNLLKTEILPYLYRKTGQFPEKWMEKWIMRYAVFVLLHSFQNYNINTVLLSVGITNSTRYNFWSCLNCSDRIKIKNACNGNCSKGYYPIYKPHRCCWNCVPCPSGFVKPIVGQSLCLKCMDYSIPNVNRTACLPPVYKYYNMNYKQRVIVTTFTLLGVAFAGFFLMVFLRYKNTPLVKSSNYNLSITQLMFHLLLNLILGQKTLPQLKLHCVLYAIVECYLLKFIISIHIVKTTQLVTIFKSKRKIDRNACVRVKEIMFPVIYFVINISITVSALIRFKIKYIVSSTENCLYKFCNIEDYLFIGITTTVLLSIFCSIKAFQARRIPANFNETYCIFLGMFATTITLLVLIPLEASFRKVGQTVFVQSCVIFCMNNTLLAISYGYKARIILFQKHKNTKEAFQQMTRKTIK